MKTLIEQLTSEFATFKVQYLEMIKEWTIERQDYYKGIQNEYNTLQHCKSPKVITTREYSSVIGNYTSRKNDFSEMTEEEIEMWNRKKDLVYILNDCKFSFGWSTEELVAKQVDSASKWFDASVVKLAVKVEAKDLNLENLQITSTYIDQNLCTIITDGIKKVKAQTIFANGCIKAPHFRYLIK